ncbi:MAG: FxsA family protein, partial [Pseudomonadota bacterium]
LLIAFVVGPFVEIYILLKAGGAFGALPVILACVATAILGGVIMRLQGFAALASARRDIDAGKAPVEAAVDGVFLLVAAPFLMTPGFMTDALGFMLLTPPIRRAIARYALSRLRQAVDRGDVKVEVRRF